MEPPLVLEYEEPPPPLTGVGLAAIIGFLSLVAIGVIWFIVLLVSVHLVD